MKVKLKYGLEDLEVSLPETSGFRGIFLLKQSPIISDPELYAATTLEEPIDSPPLRKIAEGKKNACIVISDITRPVPNKILLPPILKALEDIGIDRKKILILIATGSHRPNREEEIMNMVGRDIAKNYQVVNHSPKRSEDMSFIGRIRGDIPIYVNKIYREAELKVLTGFIEPHMWGGFSGGRKSILPGISSEETLKYLHGPEILSHNMTGYGILKGNLFHEAGLAIMEKVGCDFIVNVTLNRAKEITGIFSGNPVEAHYKGCEFLSSYCRYILDEPLDFIITTNAGAPLDSNLYQTVKGMSAASDVLKRGGVIIIASSCYEGLGRDDYVEILDMVDTPKNFIKRLMAKEFFIPDQWCAQETYQVMLRNPVWIYTEGISKKQLLKYHFKPISSIERAVQELLEKFGSGAKWAVVPDGPMVILELKE